MNLGLALNLARSIKSESKIKSKSESKSKIKLGLRWKSQVDLFEYQAQKTAEDAKPLAEKMRPVNLKEFIGQTHAVGRGSMIRHAIEKDRIFSMILWGPPGCGKTTLARIFARETRSHFVHFSAVLSGVKEIRSVIEEAGDQLKLYRKKRSFLWMRSTGSTKPAGRLSPSSGKRAAHPDRCDYGKPVL